MIRALLTLLLVVFLCRVAHVPAGALVHAAFAMARALGAVAFGLFRAAVRG